MTEKIEQAGSGDVHILHAQLQDIRFRKESAVASLEFDAAGELRDQEKRLLSQIALTQTDIT